MSGGRGSHAGWGRAAALAVAAGIGATRAAAAQGHDEAPDTVRLAFAWPAGAGATVVAERSRDLSENGVPSRAHATLRYRIMFGSEVSVPLLDNGVNGPSKRLFPRAISNESLLIANGLKSSSVKD